MDSKKRKFWGWVYLVAWVVLIASGIIAKRLFGHPDMVVFFHLPAAVCLVIGGHRLSKPYREKNLRRVQAYLSLRARAEERLP